MASTILPLLAIITSIAAFIISDEAVIIVVSILTMVAGVIALIMEVFLTSETPLNER